MGAKHFPQQKIPVHGLGDDLSHFSVFELDECVSLGSGCLLGPAHFHSQHLSVLPKVGFELILKESVGKMANVDHSILGI